MSTVPNDAFHGRDVRRFRGLAAALAAGVLLLSWYLFRPTQVDGDGAAYVLQAATGSAWDRGVHAGVLVPLWLWVRATGLAGLDPSAAANALCAAWTFAGVAAAAALSVRLPGGADPSPGRADPGILLAPLTLLGAAAVWRAGLFCEVYGPLAATTTAVAWALRARRDGLAGAGMVLAILVHPGALLLGPGLLLLGGVDPRSARARRGVLRTLAAAAFLIALQGPDWWTGGRGVLRSAAPDRSAWGALQALWRGISGDLGVAALPLLLGLAVAAAGVGRRAPGRGSALAGLGLVALGGLLGLGRWSDNPGHLPALFLAAAFAPRALRVPFGPTRVGRRLARALPLVLAAVALLGVAEATSRHDALARRAVRESADLAAACDAGPDPWPVGMRRALACLP